MDELKVYLIILGAVAIAGIVCGSLYYSGQNRIHFNEMKICVSSGGQWVTHKVAGDPSNHDCVRK